MSETLRLVEIELASLQLLIETGLFKRHCGLRREQFEHRDTGRREHARCEVVLEIEHPDEVALVDQWQTENGTGATLHQVRIGRKQILRCCILEDHGISSTHDVPNERLRQRGFGMVTVSEVHGYIRSTSGRLRLYLQLITQPGNQETPLGACVLDGGAHQSLEQSIQNH